MDRRLEESEKQLEKRLEKLGKEGFECKADALKAASTFAKELLHHELTQLRLNTRWGSER